LADILAYTIFDCQLNLGAEFLDFTSKHSSNRAHLVTCILRIQVAGVVMLSGRIIDSRWFEGSTCLQISEFKDPSAHSTIYMYKTQTVIEDALTL
jgi:hypothetical protein